MKTYVELSGRVCRPEIRTTANGKQVIRFGLSVWSGKDKEGKSTYNFVNCKHWGDGIREGADIDLVGKIAFDSWEKDGKKNVRMYILVDSFQDQKPVVPEQKNQEDLGGW